MTTGHQHQHRNQASGLAAVLVCACCLLAGGTATAAEEGLWAPAVHLGDLTTPGLGDAIRKPTVIEYDTAGDEILVGDSGNNRIVIFAANGAYRFTIPAEDHLSGISDIACHPDGYIYVLGRDSDGWLLFGFDFDGEPMGRVGLPREIDGRPLHLGSIAALESGLLAGLDKANHRALVFDTEGRVVRTIDVGSVHGEPLAPEDALGPLSIHGDTAVIPVPTRGTVLRYEMDRDVWSSVGYFGSTPGSLNFPVAATVTEVGQVLVLDQARFVVVCYDRDGKLLGEFGGKGYRAGWFYRPSLLAVAAGNGVLVGQLYENRIQICALPEYLQDADTLHPDNGRSEEGDRPEHSRLIDPASGKTDPLSLSFALVPASHVTTRDPIESGARIPGHLVSTTMEDLR